MMTAFYYFVGAGLLGMGAIYQSLLIAIVGGYFFFNTLIGNALKELDDSFYWYTFWIIVHIAFGVAYGLQPDWASRVIGVCFALGAVVIGLTYLGWSFGHRTFAWIDVGLATVIAFACFWHLNLVHGVEVMP